MKLDWKLDRQALWQQLAANNLVNGEMPALAELESPWYVRVMVGFSGWLAALFMLGFFAAGLEFIFRSAGAAIIVGAVMIVLAYMLLEKKANEDFAGQFGLALSFAGQALIVYGLFDVQNLQHGVVWLALGLLQIALAWLMPNSVHRVWSAFAAAHALSLALIHAHVYFIQAGLLMALVAYVWLNELRLIAQQQRIKPIGYGLTLALMYQAARGTLYRHFFEIASMRSVYKENWVQPWMGEALAGVVIIYVVLTLLRRQQVSLPGRVATAALIASIVLVAASIKANGISVGVMIILLGFANGNRILTGLGITALLYYISSYYYFLNTTLLEKSQLLLLLGVLLLGAFWGMRYWLFKSGEVQHA